MFTRNFFLKVVSSVWIKIKKNLWKLRIVCKTDEDKLLRRKVFDSKRFLLNCERLESAMLFQLDTFDRLAIHRSGLDRPKVLSDSRKPNEPQALKKKGYYVTRN